MENTSYRMIELFQQGGFMMYPLLLASLLGLGVIVAKGYLLWAAHRGTERVLREVTGLAREGRLEEALAAARPGTGPVATVLHTGLASIREGRRGRDVETAMESAGKIELGLLERGLVLLATVATVAPLLGFLGTVWGMIQAFAAIEAAGQVEASLVASGIRVALITTAAGLAIAIPINIAYNYFVTRIDQLIRDIEEGTSAVVELLWDVFGDEVPVRVGERPATPGAREHPLGFDTQGAIVADPGELQRPDHSTLD